MAVERWNSPPTFGDWDRRDQRHLHRPCLTGSGECIIDLGCGYSPVNPTHIGWSVGVSVHRRSGIVDVLRFPFLAEAIMAARECADSALREIQQSIARAIEVRSNG